MRKNYVEINGMNFEDCGTIKEFYVRGRGLNQCYERPSRTKQQIYEFWRNWFIEMGSMNFGVMSYNCNMFTLHGSFKYHGETYYVEITKLHHRLYKLA